MNRYRAVVFDLFGTLVRWSPDRLPLLDWKGKRFPSTMPILLPRLEQALGPGFEADDYLEAYLSVLREIEVERGRESIEITCHQRFARSLERFGIRPERVETLAEDLTRAHMAVVRSVTAAPPEWTDAARRIAARHRMALLSNFDDSQTGREIVEDTGLTSLFEAVVISADLGFRKPDPRIFRHVLELLGLDPGEVLFVGDTPREDVAGAQGVGMPVAWISRGAQSISDGLPDPDHVIPDVSALPDLLGCP